MTKVLLLEFNEICPPLLQKWIGEQKLVNFAKLYDSSQVFTTLSDETEPAYLEPWIQWYSIHTGLPYSIHNVFHLTDGPKAAHSDIWRQLQANGKAVMNCGSMNAAPLDQPNVFYLPDPWCSGQRAVPGEVEIFKEVIADCVTDYTRGLNVGTARLVSFSKFLITHGLRFQTVWAVVRQLLWERFEKKDIRWRRVALLDKLQFDVFAHYYRRIRPDFATFFINSTAHLQHAYWRHMDPGSFAIPASNEELDAYGNAVLFGYQSMDDLLGRVFSVVDDDTTVILCSALSQQPFVRREGRGGQHFYRLRDAASAFNLLGLAPSRIEPTMTHQYMLRFDSTEDVSRAKAALSNFKMGDTELFGVEEADEGSLYIGCQIFRELTTNPELSLPDRRNEPIKFLDLFYPIEGVIKSARHHPDGVLWIQSGPHREVEDKVSILDIFPTILGLMGVPATRVLPGRDLLRSDPDVGSAHFGTSGPAPTHPIASRVSSIAQREENPSAASSTARDTDSIIA